MSEEWKWGPGKEEHTGKEFQSVKVGESEVGLFFGEHPHSRSDNNIYARFPNGKVEGFNGHRKKLCLQCNRKRSLRSFIGDESICSQCSGHDRLNKKKPAVKDKFRFYAKPSSLEREFAAIASGFRIRRPP